MYISSKYRYRFGYWDVFLIAVSLVFIGIAIFAPIIANPKPLYCKYNGKTYWPAISSLNLSEILSDSEVRLPSDAQWFFLDYESVVWPIVCYDDSKNGHIIIGQAPNEEQYYLDINRKKKVLPSSFRHYLGTTPFQRDLLGSIIHSTRLSLGLAAITTLLAALIGISLGMISGYFGNKSLKYSRWQIICSGLGLFTAYFYGIFRPLYIFDWSQNIGKHLLTCILIIIFSIAFGNKIGKIKWHNRWLSKELMIPLDKLVHRLMELFQSLPLIVLLISMSAIFKAEWTWVAVYLALASWPGIARIARNEGLRLRENEYVLHAKMSGFSDIYILTKHILPNTLPAVYPLLFLFLGRVILAESALSFLGIGVPVDTISWGKLLSLAWKNDDYWWMALYPGLAIFGVILVANLGGERIRSITDPRISK